MRHLFLSLLVVMAVVAAVAQEPTTLALSKSLYAIKITDPARQLTMLEPLITRVDEIAGIVSPDGPKPSEFLETRLGQVLKTPGINATGDFWVVIMPPKLEKADPAANAKEAAPQKTPSPLSGMDGVLLVPVSDPQQFQIAITAAKTMAKIPPFTMAENFAIFTLGEAPTPKYTKIELDITLRSKRDIVMRSAMGDLDLAALMQAGEPMPPQMAPFMKTIQGLMGEFKQNMASSEVGLVMLDNELSLETIVTPKPGSPMEKSLKEAAPTTLVTDLATYLPENLAYCGSAGPKLPGMPGAGQMMLRVFTSIIGAFALPEARQQALAQQLDKLSTQCSQGRAIGLTVPATNVPGNSTLVAVYNIKSSLDATTAVRNFVQEVVRAKDAMFGGQVGELVTVMTKTGLEQVGGISVDLYKVSIVNPMADTENGGNTPPITYEFRTAYLSSLMLFTAGPGSKEEMISLVSRAMGAKPGFTAGKRFLALQPNLPENVRGFELVSIFDLCRAGINIAPIDIESKKGALKWLSVLPTPRTPISSYSTVEDGLLRSEMRVPSDQLDFLFSMVKATLTEMPGANERAKESTLVANLHIIRNALEQFQADTGVYPESLESLVATAGTAKGADGQLVPAEMFKGPYLGDETGINGIPRNPFAAVDDDDLTHHWTYNKTTGAVTSAVEGTTQDGMDFKKL